MKGFGDQYKSKDKIKKNTKPPKEKIINQAFKFHSQGNISEAAKYYQYFIHEGFEDSRVFSNYGVILKDLGKLQEAEISFLEAIKLKPDYVDAYYNLGSIVSNLGKSREVRLCSEKIISIRSWSILGSYIFNREMKLD